MILRATLIKIAYFISSTDLKENITTKSESSIINEDLKENQKEIPEYCSNILKIVDEISELVKESTDKQIQDFVPEKLEKITKELKSQPKTQLSTPIPPPLPPLAPPPPPPPAPPPNLLQNKTKISGIKIRKSTGGLNHVEVCKQTAEVS